MIAEKIVKIAKSYEGQKEKPKNGGFYDADFEKKMKEVGFSKGNPYCSLFSELVWKEAYQDTEIYNQVISLFSASSLGTWENFDNSDFITRKNGVISKTPVLGALVIWQTGAKSGHVGIVVAIIDERTFLTIEGNTNADEPNDYEGICMKKRYVKQIKGFNLIGFVTPKEIL